MAAMRFWPSSKCHVIHAVRPLKNNNSEKKTQNSQSRLLWVWMCNIWQVLLCTGGQHCAALCNWALAKSSAYLLIRETSTSDKTSAVIQAVTAIITSLQSFPVFVPSKLWLFPQRILTDHIIFRPDPNKYMQEFKIGKGSCKTVSEKCLNAGFFKWKVVFS